MGHIRKPGSTWGLDSDPAEHWRLRAACRDEDPELFFPVGPAGRNNAPALERMVQRAKAVCARCRVIEQCLRWALDHGEGHGIWGGMTEGERRSLVRRMDRRVAECGTRAGYQRHRRLGEHGLPAVPRRQPAVLEAVPDRAGSAGVGMSYVYRAIWPITDVDRPISVLITEASAALDVMARHDGARIVGEPTWTLAGERLVCEAPAAPLEEDPAVDREQRDAEISRLAGLGWSSRQIAAVLGVAHSTVQQAIRSRKAA